MKIRIKDSRASLRQRIDVIRTLIIARRIMDYQYYKDTSENLWLDQEFFGYEEYDLINKLYSEQFYTIYRFKNKEQFFGFLHDKSNIPNCLKDNWTWNELDIDVNDEPIKEKGRGWKIFTRFGGDMNNTDIYYDEPTEGILPHFYRVNMNSLYLYMLYNINEKIIKFRYDDGTYIDPLELLIVSHVFNDKELQQKLLNDVLIGKDAVDIINKEFTDMYSKNECMEVWKNRISTYKGRNYIDYIMAIFRCMCRSTFMFTGYKWRNFSTVHRCNV